MLYPLISAASPEQRRVEFLDLMEQVCGFYESYEVKSFIFFIYLLLIHLVHLCPFEPASLLWEVVFKLSYSPPQL